MNVAEISIIIIYTLWFIATAIYQLRSKKLRRYKKLDVFRLFPSWQFFAPDPIREDYHILFRDKKNNEEKGPVRFKLQYPSFSKLLFNPQGRINLAMTRLAGRFDLSVNGQKKHTEQTRSLHYQMVLNLVMRFPIDKGMHRQFLIVKTGKEDNTTPKQIFASDFHEA